MEIQPIKLNWQYHQFEPFLTPESLKLHHEKYLDYIKNLNNLIIQYPDLSGKTVTQLTLQYTGVIKQNAGQILNHEYFFSNISPNITKISVNLNDLIVQQYQSIDKLLQQFEEKAENLFGSGWIWLAYDVDNKLLLIIDGPDEYNPIMDGYVGLLCLDMWEHAYYKQYDNDKSTYIQNFWNNIDWDFVSKQYKLYL